MSTPANVEDRLTAAFGELMTPAERGTLEARVARLLDQSDTPRRRFGLRLSRSMLLVAAVILMVPLVAAAGVVMLSTEAPYGMGDADAFEAELAAAKAVTPIPPGMAWPSYLDQADDRDATYGTTLGRSMVEINAYCMWLGYWYEAHEARDATKVDAAMAALTDARTWDTFTDELTSDQGFRDNIQHNIDAAEAGDAPPVLRELELNCQGTWPPPG